MTESLEEVYSDRDGDATLGNYETLGGKVEESGSTVDEYVDVTEFVDDEGCSVDPEDRSVSGASEALLLSQ